MNKTKHQKAVKFYKVYQKAILNILFIILSSIKYCVSKGGNRQGVFIAEREDIAGDIIACLNTQGGLLRPP